MTTPVRESGGFSYRPAFFLVREVSGAGEVLECLMREGFLRLRFRRLV